MPTLAPGKVFTKDSHAIHSLPALGPKSGMTIMTLVSLMVARLFNAEICQDGVKKFYYPRSTLGDIIR